MSPLPASSLASRAADTAGWPSNRTASQRRRSTTETVSARSSFGNRKAGPQSGAASHNQRYGENQEPACHGQNERQAQHDSASQHSPPGLRLVGGTGQAGADLSGAAARAGQAPEN